MSESFVGDAPAGSSAGGLGTGPAFPKAVLFDLDGTLVNSAPDIHAALNETLASYGEPPFTIEAVIAMIGRGVPTLIERAYAKLGKDIDPAKAVERFEKIYTPRATELTTLMPGATGLINALLERGVPMGVVTNKFRAGTEIVLAHFGLADAMAIIIGGDAGPARKPAPDLLIMACRKLGVAPRESLYVGDSDNDVLAARAAGMPVVVLEGGYTTVPVQELGADAVVARLDDILHLMPRSDP